jgi:hypothetical protein
MPGRKSLPDTTLKRSREELYDRAKNLDVQGRSRSAIARKQ